jgi:hypothetical protein
MSKKMYICSMLISEIKKKFKTLCDDAYFGAIPDRKANDILSSASNNYFENLMNKYQITNAVTSELQPLIVQANFTPTNGEIDLVDIPEYKRLLAIQTTVGGKTNYAKEIMTEELGSIYSQGSDRYPRYMMISGKIIVMPDNCTNAKITYFRKPYVIDFTDPNADIPYTDVTIERLITESLSVAAKTLREDGFYQINEAETKTNSN